MLDFISIPLVVGICVAGTYGLFELFARRKERLAIIEKIGDKLDASAFEGKLALPKYMGRFSSSALKVGCLMAGIGLGLLVGLCISTGMVSSGIIDAGVDRWLYRETIGVAYGASVLLFGGIGLLIAFIIEMKVAKNK